MVLSDSEIKKALELEKLIIEPRPKANQYSPSAVDLHLDSTLRILKESKIKGLEINLADYNFHDYKDIIFEEETMSSIGYQLKPGEFLHGIKEYIELPISSCLCDRIEGRSSFARLGLVVHMTAPTIHADFRGKVVLEIMNFGPYPLKLTPELIICQLIVENLYGTPTQGLDSVFQDQTGI
ncbi:MAG: dCTP deaminase [bacterium]|nr:MAG: dCTP deaminase [bacterium]